MLLAFGLLYYNHTYVATIPFLDMVFVLNIQCWIMTSLTNLCLGPLLFCALSKLLKSYSGCKLILNGPVQKLVNSKNSQSYATNWQVQQHGYLNKTKLIIIQLLNALSYK